jgi:hypothetical protein
MATIGDGTDGVGHVRGIPALDRIQYADIDGSGQEEAVILLDSGGTAGNIGLLLYQQADPLPRLVAALGGYKLGAWLENGQLVVFQPLWLFAHGGNCCPDTIEESTYLTQVGQLVLTARAQQPVRDQVATVAAYYAALNPRDYGGAYALLGRGTREAQAFDAWVPSVEQLRGVHVDVAEQVAPDIVRVSVSLMNLDANGSPSPQTLTHDWKLSLDPNAQRWLLVDQSITDGQ